MTVASTNDDVVARIADVRTFVSSQLSAAQVFLGTLESLSELNAPIIGVAAATFTPEMPDMPGDFVPSVSVSSITSAINDLSVEAANIQDPNLVENFDDLGVVLPTAADLAGITAPTADDYNFTEVEYRSALLAILQDKIAQDIQGGTGLAADVEDAIWRRDEERRLLADQRAIDAIADEWAGRNFTMPDGVIQDAIDESVEKSRVDNLTRSRDIMIKQAELAQANVIHGIDSGIGLEGILISHHDRVMDRSLAAARAVLDVGIAVMEAQLKRIAMLVDIGKSELEARIAVERFKLEKYLAAIQIFVKKVEAALAKIRAYTELYQIEADTYKTKLAKAEIYGKLAISQDQISLQNMQANLQLSLEAAKQNLNTFIEAAKLRGQVANAGATIHANAVAAAQNSINAVIQLAASGETIATE